RPAPAPFRGDGDPEEAELPRAAHGRHGDGRGAIPLRGEGDDLAAHELARHVADGRLVLGELAHARTSRGTDHSNGPRRFQSGRMLLSGAMRIEVICTGDEVLTGKIVNTNFSYISQKLEDVGLS